MRLRTASCVLAFLCLLLGSAQAGSLSYCEPNRKLEAAELDRMIRVAGIVKRELEATGQPVALVSRSGLSLSLLGQRYSHAGVSSRDNTVTPWAVRQLYFACSEEAPRLFDQGMTGFVMGVHNDGEGYISIVTLPAEASRLLDAAARDNSTALALLSPDYSANAYAEGLRYQNCNQWLAELLAAAWDRDHDREGQPLSRAQAQAWLRAQGYVPTELELWPPLLAFGRFLSYLHFDDHPPELLQQGKLRVSLPEGIERFARQRWPTAQRVEICYTPSQVVIHKGWDAMPGGCVPREGDTVIALVPDLPTAPAY
jgi:hypothetical protein